MFTLVSTVIHDIKKYFPLMFLCCIISTIKSDICIDQNGFANISSAIIQTDRSITSQPKKNWTIVMYMAADNDLYPFAYRNIAQMKQIGSTEYLNILVHLDISHSGQPKVTKRIYIERDRIWQIGPDYKMDSGSDTTLFDTVHWAHQNFPSDHIAVVLWNHGSGDLNPVLKKTINPAQLFKYNAKTHLIELDRSIGFMDFVEQSCIKSSPLFSPHAEISKRGVCFDETNGTYLDDTKLMRAFTKIIQERGNKKLDLIVFDACLMAGTGTTYIISQFADYMVASEEVVLGAGYDYQLMLKTIASDIRNT